LVELGELRAQPRQERAAGRTSAQALCVLGAAETAEQLQLGGGDRELAVLVLAGKADERSADVAHLPYGDRAPVQIRARSAVRPDPARQHHIPGVGREP